MNPPRFDSMTTNLPPAAGMLPAFLMHRARVAQCGHDTGVEPQPDIPRECGPRNSQDRGQNGPAFHKINP
jgi:hypothetical protein